MGIETALIAGGLVGGLGLAGASMTANAAKSAANTSAQAQRDAAALAAEESRFRPIGVTTRFGKSAFTTDESGRVSGAGYELSPELKAYQDRIMALTGGQLGEAEAAAGRYAPLLGGAQSLFNLGGQYLAQSPQDVAQQYIQRQQDLLAPQRERQYANLQNQLYQTGRGGLSVGGTGLRPGGGLGLRGTNPELEAYYNALAQQDLQLAAQGQQAGQQQLAFGTGLFGQGASMLGQYTGGLAGGYSPFTAGLGTAQTIESLGQAPLEMGAAIGGRNINQTGANALLQGGVSAAKTTQAGSQFSPMGSFLSGASSSPAFASGVNTLFSPQQTSYQNLIQGSTLGAGWETPAGYAANYG